MIATLAEICLSRAASNHNENIAVIVKDRETALKRVKEIIGENDCLEIEHNYQTDILFKNKTKICFYYDSNQMCGVRPHIVIIDDGFKMSQEFHDSLYPVILFHEIPIIKL